jgi:hypothetical protein
MIWFLYIVAILFIATGSFLVLHTERALELSEVFIEKGSHRIWGIAGATFGVLLCVASFWSGVVWFLFLLGLMFAGIGMFLFLKGKATAEDVELHVKHRLETVGPDHGCHRDRDPFMGIGEGKAQGAECRGTAPMNNLITVVLCSTLNSQHSALSEAL